MERHVLMLAAAALMAAGPMPAQQFRVQLTGCGDERGFSTFRCVSHTTVKANQVFTERTQDGLKVGVLQPSADDLSRSDIVHGRPNNIIPEDRIAVIRLGFEESVAAVRGWQVIFAQQKTLLDNTTAFKVLDVWGPGTSSQAIYNLKRETTPVTQAELVAMFQQVLSSNNNTSVTSGLYLSGTANLRNPSTEPLLFDVLVQAPLPAGQTPDSTAVHAVIPVTATAQVRTVQIGNSSTGAPVTQRLNFVSFSASFPGRATVFVIDPNGTLRPIKSDLAVAAGIQYQMAIRNESLRTGANQIVLEVVSAEPTLPAALQPRGFTSPITVQNPP